MCILNHILQKLTGHNNPVNIVINKEELFVELNEGERLIHQLDIIHPGL